MTARKMVEKSEKEIQEEVSRLSMSGCKSCGPFTHVLKDSKPKLRLVLPMSLPSDATDGEWR